MRASDMGGGGCRGTGNSSFYLIASTYFHQVKDMHFKCFRIRSIREGSTGKRLVQEKWKVGAKKALLQWVQSQVGRQLNIQVHFFSDNFFFSKFALAVLFSFSGQISVAVVTSLLSVSCQISLVGTSACLLPNLCSCSHFSLSLAKSLQEALLSVSCQISGAVATSLSSLYLLSLLSISVTATCNLLLLIVFCLCALTSLSLSILICPGE